MTLIWADDDEAGVVLAPASGAAVWKPGEGHCWFTVTTTALLSYLPRNAIYILLAALHCSTL